MSFLTKFFGQWGGGDLVKYEAIVKEVNELEAKFELLAVEELKAKTQELRDRLQGRLPAGRQETLDEILPEAFALTREAAKKTLGQRHFDAQIIGGVVLHEGKIAEMKTGEGKTLTATLAIYLNALAGDGVHVVTVNDYLSKRDANWMGGVFHALGLTVGCIQHEQSFLYTPVKIDRNEVTVEMQNLKPVSRREAYLADITYGTNNAIGFYFLRVYMVAGFNVSAQLG